MKGKGAAHILFGVFLFGCAQAEPTGPPMPIPNPEPCRGTGCLVVTCPVGTQTIVRGRITYPNGAEPLGNALAYIPETDELLPLPTGPGCNVCNEISSKGVTVSTLSRTDGSFELRGAPVGSAIPLVVQKGLFRRKTTISVKACAETWLPEKDTHLPRNRSEGDIPKLAVVAGDHDAIECVLRHIGFERSEFGVPDQDQAIDLYDNADVERGKLPGQLPLPSLLNDRGRLFSYHMVFLGCSGDRYSRQLLADAQVRDNLVQYLKRGGKMYVSDWSYDFIGQLPELSPFVCFEDDQPCTVSTPHGFGQAVHHGGLPGDYQMDVTPAAQDLLAFLAALKPPIPASAIRAEGLLDRWVQMAQLGQDPVAFPSKTYLQGFASRKIRPFTIGFNYPPQTSCGRVLYTSYHTRPRPADKLIFPGYCPLGAMLPQEHILEYLLLELADCPGPPG